MVGCGNKLKTLYEEVRTALVADGTQDTEIVLYRMDLNFVFFYTSEDRNGHKNGTWVNWGEFHVETLEVYYNEYFAPDRLAPISWVKICLRGTKPRNKSNFGQDFHIGGFDDNELCWKDHCFFLSKDDYLNVKALVIQLGKDFGLTE